MRRWPRGMVSVRVWWRFGQAFADSMTCNVCPHIPKNRNNNCTSLIFRLHSSPKTASHGRCRRFVASFSFAHRHRRRVVRFSRMSKLIYITNASLDGYIEDKTGAFDWGNPDQIFDFITELMRP